MKIAMLGVKAVPCIGGIQRYTEEIGTRLVERGHEVTVYCRGQYLDGDCGAQYRGMARRTTPGLRGKHLDAFTHTFTAAIDALRRDYDVVHFHAIGPSVFVPLVRMRRRSRIVVTVHGLDWQRAKWGRLAGACLRLAGRVGARGADALMAVSLADAAFFETALGRRPVHAPPGVICNVPEPADRILSLGLQEQEYILFVSRLVPEKGCHYLIEAYKRLRPPKKLVIAGGSNYADPYADGLKQHGRDDIIFTGYARGKLLRELYSNAYVFVQPSDLEGTPSTILEALSYRRCVLASAIPGNEEALGGCGYTFEPGNVSDLSDKLAFLLENDDLVAQQAEPALRYVQRERNWGKITDTVEQVYRDAISGAAARS